MPAFNILWADDDINAIFDDTYKRLFARRNLSLKAKARNSREFQEKLKLYQKDIDAIILDANFNAYRNVPMDEKDLSGLNDAIVTVRTLVPSIPLVIFTGRNLQALRANLPPELLQDINIFSKNQSPIQMLDYLVEQVKKSQAPETIIKRKYAKAFESLANFSSAKSSPSDGSGENPDYDHMLMRCLLASEIEENDSYKDHGNNLRKIVEKVWKSAKSKGLLPNTDQFNSLKLLLSEGWMSIDNSTVGFIDSSQIINLALGNAFKYMIGVLQPTSHPETFETDYLENSNDKYYFKSQLYLVLSFLEWMHSYSLNVDRGILNKDTLWKERTPIRAKRVSTRTINDEIYYYISEGGNDYCLMPQDQKNGHPQIGATSLHAGDSVNIYGWKVMDVYKLRENFKFAVPFGKWKKN